MGKRVSDVQTMQSRKRTFRDRTLILGCLEVCSEEGDLSYSNVSETIQFCTPHGACGLDRADGPAYLRRKLQEEEDLASWTDRIDWPAGASGGGGVSTPPADPSRITPEFLAKLRSLRPVNPQEAKPAKSPAKIAK